MNLRLLLAAGFVFAADQWVKALVIKHLREGQAAPIGSHLKIRYVAHPSGRHKFLQSRFALALLWLITLAGIVFFLRQGYFFQSRAAQLALGAALGGAGSNLYDRLRLGVVIDFLDVGWWPVFNLGDVAITVGVAVALWFIR
jgi:signal peptidase II